MTSAGQMLLEVTKNLENGDQRNSIRLNDWP